MTTTRPNARRQRGKYGSALPIDPETQSVNNAALEQQRAAPADYRPQNLRHRPVARPATDDMTVEARLCRGGLTAKYVLSGREGPAAIDRSGWTAITQSEFERVQEFCDEITFNDGDARIRRRIRRVEFRDRSTGEPVTLPPIEDEVLGVGHTL